MLTETATGQRKKIPWAQYTSRYPSQVRVSILSNQQISTLSNNFYESFNRNQRVLTNIDFQNRKIKTIPFCSWRHLSTVKRNLWVAAQYRFAMALVRASGLGLVCVNFLSRPGWNRAIYIHGTLFGLYIFLMAQARLVKLLPGRAGFGPYFISEGSGRP